MCKQTAAASPAAAELNIGILILLVPALALFTGIIVLLYYAQRHTRAHDEKDRLPVELFSVRPLLLDQERE